MVTAVLDASAFLRFLDNESGAEYVERLLSRAHNREAIVLIAAVNWGEVIYTVARARGIDASIDLSSKLHTLPIVVRSCGSEEATQAALFKEKFKLPFADCFAASLAQNESAVLVTADFDFKRLPPELLKVEFLPVKGKVHP